MLMPGDLVKATREGQRMWWRVKSIADDGPNCVLDSEPATAFSFDGEDAQPLPIQPTLKRGDEQPIRWDEILDYCPNPAMGEA